MTTYTVHVRLAGDSLVRVDAESEADALELAKSADVLYLLGDFQNIEITNVGPAEVQE